MRCNAVAFGMIDTRMTNAFAEGDEGTVSVGGAAVPQGLPKHVAKMWSSDDFVRSLVPLARKGRAEEAAGCGSAASAAATGSLADEKESTNAEWSCESAMPGRSTERISQPGGGRGDASERGVGTGVKASLRGQSLWRGVGAVASHAVEVALLQARR